MKKNLRILLLLALGCSLVFSGCRRKPVEIETSSETESETKKETETQAATKKTPETEKATAKQTEKKTVAPSQQLQTQAQTQAQTQPQTQPPSSPCPYCGLWYYTTPYADGTTDYSIHVAAEEQAQADTSSGYDTSYQTGADGVQYGQCEYCFQWFSTGIDASGYSPYSEHVAAEAAYAAQQNYDTASYVQCPNCGTWVTPEDYQDHINNGW